MLAWYLNNPGVEGFFRALMEYEPTGKYTLIIPNIIWFLSSFFPVTMYPIFVEVSGLLIAGMAGMVFALNRFRFIVSDDTHRRWICLLVVLMPIGNWAINTSVAFSIVNLLWLLILLTYAPVGASKVSQCFQLAVVALMAMSHPLSFLVVPICCYNIWIRPKERVYNMVILLVIGLYLISGISYREIILDSGNIWKNLSNLPSFVLHRVIYEAILGNYSRVMRYDYGLEWIISFSAMGIIIALFLGVCVLKGLGRLEKDEILTLIGCLCFICFLTFLNMALRPVEVNNPMEQRYFYNQQRILLILIGWLIIKSWRLIKKGKILIVAIMILHIFCLNVENQKYFGGFREESARIAQFLREVQLFPKEPHSLQRRILGCNFDIIVKPRQN